jgi:hypothetical protein
MGAVMEGQAGKRLLLSAHFPPAGKDIVYHRLLR